MYDRGQCVLEDHAEAAKWYLKAANQGLPQAEFNLGLMYAKGQAVAKEMKQAISPQLTASDPLTSQLKLAAKIQSQVQDQLCVIMP